jgi:hypothetical protein
VTQAVMITATDGMQIPAQLFLPKIIKQVKNTQLLFSFMAVQEDKCC